MVYSAKHREYQLVPKQGRNQGGAKGAVKKKKRTTTGTPSMCDLKVMLPVCLTNRGVDYGGGRWGPDPRKYVEGSECVLTP